MRKRVSFYVAMDGSVADRRNTDKRIIDHFAGWGLRIISKPSPIMQLSIPLRPAVLRRGTWASDWVWKTPRL